MHDGEAETRIQPSAVHRDGAGAALAMVTALFGAGELQVFSQRIEQRRSVVQFKRPLRTVYSE